MKLIFLSGPLSGQKYKVSTAVTIGRGASNSIVLADDSVSLVHCELQPQPDNRWLARDLGSTNGTTLNEARIVSNELNHGDILAIGESRIEITMPDVQSGRTRVAPKAATVHVRLPDEPVCAPDTVTTPGAVVSGTDLSGNIFGQVTYFLKRMIARGGMGAIYEAEQFGAEGFIKKVAIKSILPSLARNETFIASFVGEAKLVANLVHQNIVQIHHLGRHGDSYFIAMEYINGINLTQFITLHHRLNRMIPVDIATFIVSRICRGLEYAHNMKDDQGAPLGLVHRDVSPNNIMINHEGEVKLTDFGVARAKRFMADDATSLVGCIEFMSPEQAACGDLDGRSDLFSLGLVYYELLTGTRIFLNQDDGVAAAVARIAKCDIPDPRKHRPDLPKAVVETLMQCLARNRDDRPRSAGRLAYTLESEMYSRGYGPTIVVLSKYIEDIQQAAAALNA